MLKETLYELLEKFPETHKSIIIKADVANRGLKLNKDIVELKDHYRNFFSLDDGTSIIANYQEESPYKIIKKDQKYVLVYNNENLGNVNFTKLPMYIKENKDSYLNTQYLVRGETCVYIYPISACSYFFKNDECRYCGFNNVWDKHLKGKIDMITNIDECVKLINMGIKECGLHHVKLTGGSLYDLKKEADVYINFVKAIREKTQIEEIYAYPQALKKEDSKRLYEAGVRQVCYDMEIWDENLWPIILPGKTKTVGRTEWLKRLTDAVEIFGRGNVVTSFVAGYELAHPDGFKDVNEAIQSNIEGFDWLIRNGIEPTFFPWSPEMPSSKTSHGRNILNLRITEVPTSYYLKLGMELHNLFIKYDMYKDLGYDELGRNSKRDRLVCYKCGYHSISQDYPRLIQNK
ncbi:radical SAM protein [Clostridium taeniosporum]|uniref:Radical SAM core domain-containing protein n=1 Tax=Clostridium taeniosporum TaxID=394958 RepID=A0A1D7XH12_9CLOT|nr:radical SAM protein [Clostridium taeniosporum]AOR22644.1 hypothetical protein BGI42_02500 [Clostridium taeniosporum]